MTTNNILEKDHGIMLFAASKVGDTTLVISLLKEAKVTKQEIDSALYAASSEGHYNTVNLLLAHGADVDACGGASMFSACFNNRDAVVRLLEQHGATPTDAWQKKNQM